MRGAITMRIAVVFTVIQTAGGEMIKNKLSALSGLKLWMAKPIILLSG